MRKILVASVVSLEVIASGSAMAQEAAPPPVAPATATATPSMETIERITITATKREQTLKDVPISVSVTTAATLEKAHIVDLIDLQSVVPSLKVTQFNAVGQTNFIIRGFGNGAGNDGIESSVGVFVDGVYRSRTSSALDDLPKVSRIEVLRGPQSTLFGKNVSAGAISIITAKPQFGFGGSASLDFGSDKLAAQRFTLTGPLTDELAVQVSGSNNKRDGYLINDVTGNKVNDRDRQAFRADLLWLPSSDLSVRVIADYNKINEICCGTVQLANGGASQFVAAPPPAGLGGKVADPDAKFDDRIAFNTDPSNRLTGKGVSAQVDWKNALGTLTSITAKRKQTNASTQDVDFTGADLANKNQGNKLETFSQELRLTSTGDGPARWMVGGYFQTEKLKTGVDTSFGGAMRSFADGLSGKVAAGPLKGRSNIFTLEYLQSLVTPALVTPNGTYFQAGQGIQDHYTMDQDSSSIFGNLDYALTDNLTLTGGLAYMHDRKRASSAVVLTDKFSALNLQAVPQLPIVGQPANAFAALNPLQFFYGNTPNHGPVNIPNALESGELEGDKLTSALRLAYDFGNWNGYASYNTGWKAGAFNLSSDSRPPNANGIGRTADPEEVSVFELGLKTESRRGYLTLAIFDQTIKGFQSNLYTGTGYSLANAGKQSTRGFEVDSAYRPTGWLTLTGGVTYLDPKYDSFTHAPCVSFDPVQCAVNPATGQRPPSRDLSGKKPAGIPTWSASTSAMVTQDFGAGYSGFMRVEYEYASKTQLAETTPAELSTYGRNNVNASIGFASKPHHIEVMLWARNLLNERTIVGAFPTVAQEGSYSGFSNQPRTVGVTLTTKF